MTRVSVSNDCPAYRVALQELPLSTTLVAPGGAEIAVVGGPDWVAEAAGASRSARVVIVAGGLTARAEQVDSLRRQLSVPVLFERPWLRLDLVEDALSARAERRAASPWLLLAECRVGRVQLPSALADLVGWCRVLTGDLVIATVQNDRHWVSALLLGGVDQVPITLRLAVTDRHAPLLRVTAVGEVTTDIVIDDLAGRPTVSTRTGAESVGAPTRWETAERLTLRRARAALDAADQQDLAALSQDTAIAAALLE